MGKDVCSPPYTCYFPLAWAIKYICIRLNVYIMEDGDTNFANKKLRKMGFQEQRRLLILQCEEIVKKLVPCKIEKVIAEIEYQTGMTSSKAKQIVGIFFKRDMLKIKNEDKEKILGLNNAKSKTSLSE